MDPLEDPSFNIKYKKSKLRVKLWEGDFMEKYGRKPNKNDIREADMVIRDAYKMYWKLKTQALEETLMDITFSDDIQANISTTSLSTSVLEDSCTPQKALQVDACDTENLKPETVTAPKDTDFEAVPSAEEANAAGVWGDHLNHKKKEVPQKKPNLLVGRSSSFQLSQKKFENTSFTKRNPRKSLSMVKSRSKSELDINTSVSSASTEKDDSAKVGFDPIEIMKPMCGDKLKIVRAEPKLSCQSVSAIRGLIEGKAINTCRKLDAGWLERCSQRNNVPPVTENHYQLSGTSESGIESLESSLYSPSSATPVFSSQTPPVNSQTSLSFSDDEDFICNSDSEGERRNKRSRNIKRNFNYGDTQTAKRPCLKASPASTNFLVLQESLTNEPSLRIQPHSQLNKTVLEHSLLKEPIAINNDKIAVNEKDEQEISTTNIKPPTHVGSIETNEYVLEPSTKKKVSAVKKSVPKVQRKVFRRIIANEPQDSDSDAASDDNKTKPKTVPKTRKTRATPTTTKKQATRKSKKIAESEVIEKAVESNEPVRPTYEVETVNAVSRFALSKMGSGDLVADFSRIVSDTELKENKKSGTGDKIKKNLTGRARLEQKSAAGNMNENFVRLNLKKKVFVRGKKTMTFQKYKKNQWKQKKKELASGGGGLDLADLVEKKGVLTCFKCGDIGHFSRECKALKSDNMLPLIGDEEPVEYPTLEEAAKMASDSALTAHKNRLSLIPRTVSRSVGSSETRKEESTNDVPSTIEDNEPCTSNDNDFSDLLDDVDFTEDMVHDNPASAASGHVIPEELLARLLRPEIGPVKPLYPIESNNQLSVTPDEVFEALKKFGHEKFKPGQEKAVMRILSGQSTLVTLSTGSGKSLCYQLPAYLYAQHSTCITLVISPLVSLMDDQVTGVPRFLSAACLHTAQGAKQRANVMEKVKQGTLNILLVSPEAVVAGEKSTGFGALLRQLPPIAFACIDEAHCISQWSHNFRPSYLMVCKVLREKLGVKTVLGLTATATKSTAQSIVDHLRIPDGMAGVISDTPLPRNLTLTVSKDPQRDRAIVNLLETERFKDLDSIIVYCTRRDECVRIAGILRTRLFDPKVHSTVEKVVSAIAEPYHAGLSASRRKIVQQAFMKGKIRIVVATVAFGMGINKPDIRAVIHYNMPSSFESYVQEVGRAGRDGKPAHCHLFISSQEEGDKFELRRHIYANGVDRHMVRRLLQKVFVPCHCTKTGNQNLNKRCPGHEVSIPVDAMVQMLDIPQEIISTLLCYLELHPKKFITNLPSVYVNAKVTSYNGPQALKAAAQSSPPLAMAIALDLKRNISHEKSSIIEFPVVEIAAAIGWDSGVVKGHLKELEWKTTSEGSWKRTPISVVFDTLGFRVRAPGDLSNAELDEALDILNNRSTYQQKLSLCQLEIISSAMSEVAVDFVRQCRELDEETMKRSETLKTTIRNYFQTEDPIANIDLKLESTLANEAQIAGDVRSLVQSYRDCSFTGRAVARIFHGIQSPNYSALVWSRARFWRSHLSANFELLCQIATREILAMR